MAGNTIGALFTFTSFGESHGDAYGGVIDGCPPGLIIDINFIESELARRKPSEDIYSTSRIEDDSVEFLSGVFDGKTTGTPIGFILRNKHHQPNDYSDLKEVFRPSHADFVYEKKYGLRDFRGGGRASARETVVRVVAGAIAKLYLASKNIEVLSYVSAIGNVKVDKNKKFTSKQVNASRIFCPDTDAESKMFSLLEHIKNEGDSIGAEVYTFVNGVPVGLGEPVFDKLQADLAKAMMSINAAKGFEYGEGFNAVAMKGSENNDVFVTENNKIKTSTNHSGGILGGISNGMPIYFSVAFKPIASILKPQHTVDKSGNAVQIKISGRHDVCVAPRVVPVVEAMTALVITDHLLRYNAYKDNKNEI